MPKYFPIFLDLKDRPCLVVGAGEIATHKAAQLLKYGAKLTIVAPEGTDQVEQWAREGKVRFLKRPFEAADVEGSCLVVGSTNDGNVNRTVFEEASSRGILANIVDVPELCSFVYGALVERGDLQIAISTSGRSPAYASHLRHQIELEFGQEYGQYLDILGQAREETRKRITDMNRQKQVYQDIMKLDLLSLVRSGQTEEARRRAFECISQSLD